MSQIKTQVISDAMEKAALAVNMIVGCEAKVLKMDFTFPNIDGEIQYSTKTDPATHVIQTAVAGNLSGSSYLILSPEDVDKIHAKCLPENVVKSESAKDKMLKGALLLEMDNIVSASAVTVFANHMDEMLYGDVPKLKVLSRTGVNEFLASEIEEMNYSNYVNVALHIDQLDITLDFFWAFENSFFKQLLQPKVEAA